MSEKSSNFAQILRRNEKLNTFSDRSMHEEMLTYGLKKGTERELVHIDRVQNGLKCDCECPCCGKPLEACQGTIRQHFFRHASGVECKGARMTALHLLAQNILERDKKVMLPAYNTHKACIKTFKFVKLEQVKRDETSTLIPDCVCSQEKEGDPLWVEIYCRHKVDEIRKQKIRQRKKYCIEIDFSDLLNTDYTEEDVIRRLTIDTEHRKWICCPKWDNENEEKKQSANHNISIPTNFHFILYPNGEATLTLLEKENIITPTNDSIYEAKIVVSNAATSAERNPYNIYHYFYLTAKKEVYKQRDCRMCEYRKYAEQDRFHERDIQIYCKFSRANNISKIPPRYAITCSNYKFDEKISSYINPKNVKLLKINYNP